MSFFMKSIALTSLLFLFSVSLFSQDTAEVHIVRKTGFSGSLVGINLIMDGELLCKVSNKRYSIHQVEAGAHAFQARLIGKKKMTKKSMAPLEMNLVAGKTYYLQLNLKNKAFYSQVDVQEITETKAVRIMPDLKKQKNCRTK